MTGVRRRLLFGAAYGRSGRGGRRMFSMLADVTDGEKRTRAGRKDEGGALIKRIKRVTYRIRVKKREENNNKPDTRNI